MPRVLRAFLSDLRLLLCNLDYTIVLQMTCRIAWNLVSLAFRISEPNGLARSFCPDSLIDLTAKNFIHPIMATKHHCVVYYEIEYAPPPVLSAYLTKPIKALVKSLLPAPVIIHELDCESAGSVRTNI
jgi:hypothetical protein